jgi:hypothetical protein
LSGILKADAPLALMQRKIAQPITAAPAPVTSPLRKLAVGELYPGFSAVTEIPAADPNRWPTVVLARP